MYFTLRRRNCRRLCSCPPLSGLRAPRFPGRRLPFPKIAGREYEVTMGLESGLAPLALLRQLAVVHPHALVREGVAALLSRENALHLAWSGSDWPALLRDPVLAHIDLILCAADSLGAPVLRALRELPEPPRLLVIGTAQAALCRDSRVRIEQVSERESSASIRDRLRASSAAVARPARTRQLPGQSITPRESMVADLLARGCSNAEIATRLGLTRGTVRVYVSRVLGKLGARDRIAAALYLCGAARAA